jgi:hypothetical protein
MRHRRSSCSCLDEKDKCNIVRYKELLGVGPNKIIAKTLTFLASKQTRKIIMASELRSMVRALLVLARSRSERDEWGPSFSHDPRRLCFLNGPDQSRLKPTAMMATLSRRTIQTRKRMVVHVGFTNSHIELVVDLVGDRQVIFLIRALQASFLGFSSTVLAFGR